MSDTNRVGVAIERLSQSTFPLTGARTLTSLRNTGQPGLAFAPTSIVSNEIREDRQISDSILVGAEAGGDSGIELSYNAFDLLIESALFSTFNATSATTLFALSGSTDITITTDNQINVPSNGSAFKVGHIIELRNVDGGDIGRGIYEITNIVTDALTVSALPGLSTDNATNATAAAMSTNANTTLTIVGYIPDTNGDVDTALSGNVASITGGAGEFDNLFGNSIELPVGTWIKISQSIGASNNVWARVTARTATQIDFDAPTGFSAETETGRVQIFYGAFVRNGADAVTSHQFLVERAFNDHSPVTREAFLQMAINTLAINLQPQQIATGTITFFGTTSQVSNNENAGTGQNELYATGVTITRNSAPTFDVYNTSSNVGRIGRGDDPVAAAGLNFVLGASININNNLRRQLAVGVLGAAGIGLGEFSVTGSLNTYFDNKDLLQQLIDNSETSVDITVRGIDGRSMTFDLPRIKFTTGPVNVPGKNQDATIDLAYQALLSSVFGYTMHVQRTNFAQ